ncbi:DUF2095 family protein [Thermogladius sp. 4427co]|uniref:DUF2095 family protein n=1 Tax=Thermogladius sp. 4427co TaxID=3450718 RepID=UPI003F7A4B86
MSIDEFRRKYPNLARELLDEDSGVSLPVDKGFSDPWRGYLPNVYDYLKRCRDEREAIEVVEYLVKHGELSAEEGEHIKELIEKHGLSYFGEKKVDDYYYKTAQAYWRSLRRLKP